jgi:hypothetical protein
MNIQLGNQMGLNKDHGIGQSDSNLDSKGETKENIEQPVYALGLECSGAKKEKPPFMFPWNCIKDQLYPETNYLRNIKNMAFHEQENTIRTYISCVYPNKNRRQK